MDLKGSSAVITGGARGLGASLARELVENGGNVLISDIDGGDLRSLAKELDMPSLHCNVTDREQVEALGRYAMERFGQIDLWINNAGIWMPYMPALEIDFNKARQLIDVNYFGTAYGMLEAVKHMQPRGAGTILNILSVRSLKGKALGAAYSASKFAAEGFTQAVRDELKDTGISVLGVYPYRMKTGLFGEHKHKDYAQSMEPDDVAKIITDNLIHQRPAEHLEIWSATDVRKSYIV
ncbi:MAG: SDR family oxidoreductase [Candidatus Kaiserbacteria bacterium]|nr:SDR family oxidoreductase [Candidatus Kaiserbacteria bacterium]